MPLVHRTVTPVKLSANKLNLGRTESEFLAVNNGSLVNILRQLSSLMIHANDIFKEISGIAVQVGGRITSVKLRLDELEAKVELFDPKLVPVRKCLCRVFHCIILRMAVINKYHVLGFKLFSIFLRI